MWVNIWWYILWVHIHPNLIHPFINTFAGIDVLQSSFFAKKSLENYSAYCCSIMRYIIRGQIYLFPSPVPGIGLSASQLPRITQNMSYTRKLPGTGNKEPLLRLRSCQCNKFRRNYAQALSHNLWPHARISAWVYLGDRTILYTRIYLSNQFSLRFKIP